MIFKNYFEEPQEKRGGTSGAKGCDRENKNPSVICTYFCLSYLLDFSQKILFEARFQGYKQKIIDMVKKPVIWKSQANYTHNFMSSK